MRFSISCPQISLPGWWFTTHVSTVLFFYIRNLSVVNFTQSYLYSIGPIKISREFAKSYKCRYGIILRISPVENIFVARRRRSFVGKKRGVMSNCIHSIFELRTVVEKVWHSIDSRYKL